MNIQEHINNNQHNGLNYNVFDAWNVAEFCISLDMKAPNISFKAFVNIEIEEGKTFQDVEAQYLQNGKFNFEKFISENSPLNFVPDAYDDEGLLEDESLAFLHLCHQEDFVSPYRPEDNIFIQNKILEIYKTQSHT